LASLTKIWFLVEIAIMESDNLPTIITKPGQIRDALLAGHLTTDELIKVAREGLNATKTLLNNGQAYEVPDYPVRHRYLEFLTHTIEGMPVKRQEIVTKQMTDVTGLKDKLKSSPALVKSMRRVLEQADEAAGIVDADTETD
jgi:hypothetical protein